MSHFASLIDHLSEQTLSSAAARKKLAEEIMPELQKALNDLRQKSGVFGLRVDIDEFEKGEDFESDFQIKWAASEDWRRFDGNVPPKFERYREDLYELIDALDTLAPIVQFKMRASSEVK